MRYPRYLFWTDFETTSLPNGMDFSDVHVLEVAVIVTDLDLNPKVGYRDVVAMTQEAAQVIRGNQFVKEMHTKSGLLRECIDATQKGEALSLAQVEQEILNILGDLGGHDDFIIAGSGVAAFDFPLIKVKMPTLATWLAYFPFDIGVMRRVSRILTGKEIVSHTSMSYGEEKVHRAMADVEAHLEEARKYRVVLREAFSGA